MMQAREIQPGDVLEFPETGMMMVREVEPIPATEEARISHVRLKCAVGRTDEGFELILPGFLTVDVYRSAGTVESVGGGNSSGGATTVAYNAVPEDRRT